MEAQDREEYKDEEEEEYSAARLRIEGKSG
jgi:hypothetical protein